MKNYKSLFKLDRKTAVVTGGAGLIGKEVVTALAVSGARVIIADIDKKGGQAISRKLSNMGYSCSYINFNITHIPKLKKAVSCFYRILSGIDIWVNTAYPRTHDWGAPVEKITESSWRKNIDMHLNAYALVSKYVAEMMKKKGGSIINFGSIYGIVAPDFSVYNKTKISNSMIYSAIKGGITNVDRYLASYYGKYNIRVNTICPGGVFDNQDKRFVSNYKSKTPLKRMAKPQDIAPVTVFLASEAASYITGATIMVDGGWTAI
ncbi:MAG: SDR family oxidoreductase [Elusimicrobia bacterium]|nr:SDR family oxidoreductase [Elusimicrobiota bacterium]MBD3412716.1 SDR family oxidoreductase [Elusimicrobiota bacterium]